jgi:hypothetical protein
LHGLTIVNYCHPHCQPFQSITRLPEKEAFEKAGELSAHHTGNAFGRFADFVNYYPRRISAEKWLYEQFVSLGGKPETEHPLYFVLQGSEYLHQWFDSGATYTLSLDQIRREHISFTFGNSAAKMDKPERKPPFLKNELYALVEEYGSADAFLDSIREVYTYIEVQLWSDTYIPMAIRS